MKTVTINLPEEVYQFWEVRAAMDDVRISEGIEWFLSQSKLKHQGLDYEANVKVRNQSK